MLDGFRLEEFLALTELLLDFPVEQDQAALDAAPFRLERPEPRPEKLLPPLPSRWYPRPAEAVIEAARESLVPPPRTPVFDGRAQELARVLRPLLSGHPVRVEGEAGVGKSALLRHIAAHERTRQRFRRIWWIDQPDRLDQTLTLALDLPHTLAETDPDRRRRWFAKHLDDHTLLIVDNLTPEHPLLDALPKLTDHVLLGVETVLEAPDPDEPLPEDPDGVVTLRGLDPTAATEVFAAYAGLDDLRRIRAQVIRSVTALGLHPYALMLAGVMVRHDGLTLDELESLLALDANDDAAGEVAAGDVDDSEDDATPAPVNPSVNRALDVSLAGLPRDYRRLFAAFAGFPPGGAPFDGLCDVSRLRDALATRRGLLMLERYGFIRHDHRDEDRYVMHTVAYARAVQATFAEGIDDDSEQDSGGDTLHDNKVARTARGWAARYARTHSGDPVALYHAETSLCAAWIAAEQFGPKSTAAALDEALTPYVREYVPGQVDVESAAMPGALDPVRQEAADLTQQGLEATDARAYDVAEQVLLRALELREEHDSAHAIAETEVALGRLYDVTGRHEQALDVLLRAAERVFNLGATSSLSVVRRALARVYRHLGRLPEALEVLDDGSDAHYERALILRAQGKYARAAAEMAQAEDSTPYDRAEIMLLAGQYAEALDAIKDATDAESAHLRAQAYHMQGHTDEAIRGYRMALEQIEASDRRDPVVERARPRVLRGLGAALARAALAGEGSFDEARETLEAALVLSKEASPPVPAREGGVLRMLAALHLVAGDLDAALDNARAAAERLKGAGDPVALADAYRTLGRVLWRQGDVQGALDAFKGEVEHAQAAPERDEARIGIALHHVADAHRAVDELDRAIANYRRALTHKDAAADPHGYLVTELALVRTLREALRLNHAFDAAQELVDRLVRHPDVDLQHVGIAQAYRARTQFAIERPIRARQSVLEWAHMLLLRSGDALADSRPAMRVLTLGVAVRSLLAEDRPALALPLAEQAEALTREHFAGGSAHWAAIRDLGETYMALDRPEEAIITLEPVLNAEIGGRPDQAASVAHAYTLTGRAYRAIGDHENALGHLRLAIEYEPDDHLKSLLHEQIAEIQLGMGRTSDAVASLRTALPLVNRDDHVEVAARIQTSLAHTLGGLNRYSEAITVYEDALNTLRDVPGVSPAHTADVLRSLGRTHEAQGQLPEAARSYRRALNILERHEDAPPRLRLDILHQLARVTAQMGDQTSVSLFEQVRDLTQQWGEQGDLGGVLCELANVHRDAGRYPLAISNYQAALESQPAPPLIRERINTLRNLGRALGQMGRFDEARSAWTEALELSGELPDQSPDEMGLTHHAIAEAYRHQSHYDDAQRSYNEALRYLPERSIPRAASLRGLGQTQHAAGRPEEAVETLRKALEIEKALPQQANTRLVQTLQLLSEAHESAGRLDMAAARLHETLVYMDRTLQPVAYADTLRTLGRLYRANGRYHDAQTALNEAVEIETSHVPRSDERIAATLQAIADTYRAAGNLEKAAEFYKRVTVYANMARQASEDLRATLDELDRRRAALEAARQSLALLDRSDDAGVKDVAFIYALIAHSQARLNQPQQSVETIHTLLDVLDERQTELDTEHEDGDIRALAWLLAAARAVERQDDISTAEYACGAALEDVRNSNLRWVIEQVTRSLEPEGD